MKESLINYSSSLSDVVLFNKQLALHFSVAAVDSDSSLEVDRFVTWNPTQMIVVLDLSRQSSEKIMSELSSREILNASRIILLFGELNRSKEFLDTLEISVNSKIILISTSNSRLERSKNRPFYEIYDVKRSSRSEGTPLHIVFIGTYAEQDLNLQMPSHSYDFDGITASVGIMVCITRSL